MTRSGPGVGAAAAANVLWFLPTHGDGRYLGTTSAPATSRSRT